MIRTRQLEYMRPAEIMAERERASIAYLPVGPLEWHGPAMPYGTDGTAAHQLALATADLTGGIVLPPLFMGTENCRPPEALAAMGFEDTQQYIVGMDFPNNTLKSMYAREEILTSTVREFIRQVQFLEFKMLVIVSGHGATSQTNVLNYLEKETNGENPDFLVTVKRNPMIEGLKKYRGHATSCETALQMVYDEENVDLSLLPPVGTPILVRDFGIADYETFKLNPTPDFSTRADPREATRELGVEILRQGSEYLADEIKQAYQAFLKR